MDGTVAPSSARSTARSPARERHRRALRGRIVAATVAAAVLVASMGVPAAAADPPAAASGGTASAGDLAQRWFVDFFDATPQDWSAGRATVVTVAGDVQRDGVVTFETVSLGVRGTPRDRTPLVDVPVPTVGLVLEPADRTLDRGEPLTLTVDRRGRDAWAGVLVDGRLADLPRDAGRTQSTSTVPAPVQGWPRRSVVTGVAQLDDERLQAESGVFTGR